MAFRLRNLSTLMILTSLIFAVLSTNAHAGSLEAIQTKIDEYLKSPGVRSAVWGIKIADPTAGKVLLAINPDQAFQPASIIKIVTTAAALERLGPNFKYHTSVYTDGSILPDGVLSGKLILVGRGDPNLVDDSKELLEKSALSELAEKLRNLGIKEVRGDIIGDDSYFDATSHGKGWTAQDLRSSYGAPVNALSINNNVFWIHARATKHNQPVRAWIVPQTSYFRISNKAVTGISGSEQTISAQLIPGTKTIVVSGVLPSSKAYSRQFLLENPADVAATMFKEELNRQGINTRGKAYVTHHRDTSAVQARQEWKLLVEHQSVPLFRAMERINKESQNLHAEMLLRTLGAEFKAAGTDEAGLQVVREFLMKAGIDCDKISLNDGCGLSRDNLMTPHFQISLLQYLFTRPYFGLFLNTLAISGVDGTLKNRLSKKQVKGCIYAKTGSLNEVCNISGYMITKSGRNLVFCIFVNNVKTSKTRVRRTIDEICALFANLY